VEAGASKYNACRCIGISLRTIQRWVQGGIIHTDQRPQATRPTPANRLSEEERKQILEICNSDEFADIPPSKIVPMLADRGIFIASESTYYRVLKDHSLLKHRGRSKPKGTYKRPESFTARQANQVWTWDITYCPTKVKGLHYYLYLIVDVYSRKIVAAEVYEEESGQHAANILQRAIWSEKCDSKGLVLHSDNGGPMKSFTMQAKMHDLGVVGSRSRPRVSNDNPYSESLFRTMKYCPQWPSKGFGSLDEVRQWDHDFVRWYNEEHRHSGIKYVTPGQRHRGEDCELLRRRDEVYRAAKNRHPKRWTSQTRNWDMTKEVHLNPLKPKRAA
jgi:transposase InsO family protein